jgi:hypothetical protein
MRMSRVHRRFAVLLAAPLLASAVLAGCSRGPERLSQEQLFDKVVAAEAKSGSSHVSMTLTTPANQTIKSRGQMIYGRKPSDTAMAMTVAGQQQGLGSVEVRLVDQAFYIRLGELTQGKFAKIDLTDEDNPIARQYGDLIENIDPGRQVRQYKNAVTKFDNTGDTVKIDNVETVPYKITIDPSKTKQFKNTTKNLPKSITFVLYVGPDDLPRRMTSAMPGASGESRLRMGYSHWGEKVVIEAPNKSNIATGGPLAELTR